MPRDTQNFGSSGFGLGRLYRAFWRFGAPDRVRMVGFLSALVTAALIRLSVPYFTGDAVNALQARESADFSRAAWDMADIFAACAFSWMLHGPGRVIERQVASGIRSRFTDELYAKVVSMPMSWHESHHSGETIHRVGRASSALYEFSQTQFIHLANAVYLIGPILALAILSPVTGAVAFAGYLGIALVLVRFDEPIIRLTREYNAAENHFSAGLVDCLGNISTVISLHLRDATRRMLGHRLDAVFAPLRRSIVLTEMKWCTIDLMNNGIRCFLVVLYVWLAWRSNGAVMLGSAVMVFQYTQQAGAVIGSMATSYQDLVRYGTDFGSAADLITDLSGDGAAMAAITPIGSDWRLIEIEGIDFTYRNSHRRAATLEDVSLTLRRGERVALVGASGSGKSTLLRLLAGLYDADRARFRIDGEDRPGLSNLAAIAMLVPQDPELFESSIGQNITLGVEHGPAAIRRACEIAGFASVLDRLPNGLDTGIAERGVNLSGGQKQRLALARGILAAASSSLIMLDEPTSSLDAETEARILDHLHAAFPDSAILSTIHRLHLLPRFDRIVLMAEGRVVDSGPLAELLERQAGFRTLWQEYVGTVSSHSPGRDGSQGSQFQAASQITATAIDSKVTGTPTLA